MKLKQPTLFKTVTTVVAGVVLFATLVAGSIESRARVAAVERDIARLEIVDREIALDVAARMNEIRRLILDLRVLVARLETKLEDWR